VTYRFARRCAFSLDVRHNARVNGRPADLDAACGAPRRCQRRDIVSENLELTSRKSS